MARSTSSTSRGFVSTPPPRRTAERARPPPARARPRPPGGPRGDGAARPPAPAPAAAVPSPEPEPASGRSAVGVLERPHQPSGDDDLLELLAAERVEAIDRRATGGALWVVGGPEPRELLARPAARARRLHVAAKGGPAA